MLIIGDVFAEDLGDLSCLDCATAIFVKECEGSAHVLLIKERLLIDRGRAPLSKVDCSALVSVGGFKDFERPVNNLLLVLVWVELFVTVDKLLLLNETIAIFVPLVEGSAKLCLLLLGGQVSCHEGQRRLLELRLVL